MRVARLHGVGDIRIGDEPVPEAGPGETLVQVSAVGICGSDLHWLEGELGGTDLAQPLVLGHEAAGVIAEGPRRVQLVAIGDTVHTLPAMPGRLPEPLLPNPVRRARCHRYRPVHRRRPARVHELAKPLAPSASR